MEGAKYGFTKKDFVFDALTLEVSADAVAETVRQQKEADPSISTFVGGAVVTDEYARSIGATYYTKDAMASVRLAKEFFSR